MTVVETNSEMEAASLAVSPQVSTAPVNTRHVRSEPKSAIVGLLTERLSQADLHQHFLDSLGAKVVSHSSVAIKPLDIDLAKPLPVRLRVYLYNATRPPGGRPLGEHKIQLIVPGQRRGDRGSFDHGDGRIVILAGLAAEEDVFILWDSGLYESFAWSRNVQVKAEKIVEASVGKIAIQMRHMRPPDGASITETLLACPSTHLAEAIAQRIDLTRRRMAGF